MVQTKLFLDFLYLAKFLDTVAKPYISFFLEMHFVCTLLHLVYDIQRL